MRRALWPILILFVALLVVFRVAPTDADAWHIDPRDGEVREGHFVVRPEGGDLVSPHFETAPQDLLAAFDEIAMATPRTIRLAGSVEEGRVTYETRSVVFGFPDYTTVEAVTDGEGVHLLIFARLRFGRSDLGVNEARVTGWLEALEAVEP